MSLKPVADLAHLKGTNCQFKFIGEGAANIVFEVIFPHEDVTITQDDGDSKILNILQGYSLSYPILHSRLQY